jgi:hypothetical protein
MTRIVIEPSDLRRGASTLRDTALGYHGLAQRLGSLPMPEMPPGVAARVQADMLEAARTLSSEVVPLFNEADELLYRALWAEISGAAGHWPEPLGFLRDNGAWIKGGLGFFGPGGVLPALVATAYGYRLVPRGKYVTVRGQPFRGDSLLHRYLRTARPDGTRYLVTNPKVAKYLGLGPGLAAKAEEILPMNSKFLQAAGKGSGPLAFGLTLGGDVYDYTAGPYGHEGLVSTDFAATATVDVGLVGGTAAVGTAAAVGTTSLFAGGAAGASVGSIAPGIGTAVGFAVGIGIAWGMSTEQGKWVRGKLIEGTKSGIEYGLKNPILLGPTFGPPVAGARLAYEYGDDALRAVDYGLDKAGGVIGDAAGGAKKLAGKIFG